MAGESLRDRLRAVCREANASVGDVSRALASLLTETIIAAADSPDAAASDIAIVTAAMNEHVAELQEARRHSIN
jgi:hypothetical protein